MITPPTSPSTPPSPDPSKGPLLGQRSFTIVAVAIVSGILAYPIGGWFAAVAGGLMIAGALHGLLGY
jgi:hypothetical protein